MPMKTNCPDCVWDIEGPVIKGYTPCDTCRLNTLHDSEVDTKGWKWTVRGPYCFKCKKDMRGCYEDELDNETTILFTGGYGSFIDCIDGKLPMLVICHECGHSLCEFLGVDPRNWHTHSILGTQHPDHHDNNRGEDDTES